ncbi:MAG: cyclase family protein [Candidatus Eremiobacteraeota bacterium]|nr:cyclase family protein [Candidatus Eremiobacteraeota bacterium]
MRWKRRPDGSTWGDWGDDDRLGRLNTLTPERVLEAVREVRVGKRFCLSLPLDYPGASVVAPHRKPPALGWVERGDGTVNHEFQARTVAPGATDVMNDDYATLYLQYSTQWDSFAHIGSLFDANGDGAPEVSYYNGIPDHDVAAAAVLGLQGRGVLLDLRKHFGDGRTAVNFEMLERVMRDDRIDVRTGDFVLFHTGYATRLLEMGGKPDPALVRTMCAVLDGNDARLIRWVDESGVVALIADNLAVENPMTGRPESQYPKTGPFIPLHELCLFKLGVMIGELWYLAELAAWLGENARSSFLLTAPPLRLPGAVGSPVTPIATV